MDSQNKTFNKYIIIEEKIFNKLSLKIKKDNIKNKYVYIYYNRYLRNISSQQTKKLIISRKQEKVLEISKAYILNKRRKEVCYMESLYFVNHINNFGTNIQIINKI